MQKETHGAHLQEGYLLAYDRACAELSERNPEEIAANSGVVYDKAHARFQIQYLDQSYTVEYPSGQVAYANIEGDVPVAAKIVLLHYLLKAGGMPETNQLISFKDIPDGGMIYFEPFRNRVLMGFIGHFGKDPQKLRQAGLKVGGTEVASGSAAIRLQVLPNLPMTYVIWEGDEEFPANATVLFDANVRYYLPTEDLVVAAAAGASLLNRTARSLQ